ncbi:MAG: phenylalanine--tRNA ligase subunit beta [Verrucomicrobia bacterium]|nr:phenylalanine--tRNA ligase subunit beta [Verrucomicrobiota bacterium]MCG2795176.1 phenylalanine--tRNA ligase subunit beta [Actinomycetes bacterium]MCG2818340.1 phenylalanine--tRNA ligase subunit beta [Actinomycetes bacterium]
MRVSLEWLSEYVDIAMPPEELADLLSISGTAVDRVIRMGTGVSGVVVGRVVQVGPHPHADDLKVVLVEDGTLVREIVCGAPNLREGAKYALAIPGARLPVVSDKKLRRATIRGVESDGMLCSGAELGLSEDRSAVLELEPESAVGLDLHDLLPLQDVILELEVTPNRPDCMSMVGVAREVAALTGAELKLPVAPLDETGGAIEELAKVFIKDRQGCPRYSARVVTGVEIAPSPQWMQRRLMAAGLRPINNIVDVTNYVLLELGQPLHAFDLELLDERTVVVRLARHGEVLTTLDGALRQLDDRSLVIADISRPIALAGIIGGEDSQVTESTTSVLIESAYFDPTSILLTSKRLGIRTEASSRFERGTDPSATMVAARRAAYLMASQAGGINAAGDIDVYPEAVLPVTIDLRPERVNRVLGSDIPTDMMVEILESLEAEVDGNGALRVKVPTFRGDLEREIDLIEEIARIHGYAKIPGELPRGDGLEAGLSRDQKLDADLYEALLTDGLYEVITYSLIFNEDLDRLLLPPGDRMRRTVEIMNPLAGIGEVMRTTLLPGLLRVASNNINRGNSDLALFERGRVFFAGEPDQLPDEVEAVGILLCGTRGVPGWFEQGEPVDFYDIKGVVESVARRLGVTLGFQLDDRPYFAPGSAARVELGDGVLGHIGQLHPRVAEGFGLEGEYYVGEIAIAGLFESANEELLYRPVGRFPAVKVDIALVVDEGIEAARVEGEIRSQSGEYLQAVRLFDVYMGPQIPFGKKSLAFALEFGSDEGTLTDRQAHDELDRIVAGLESELGASLRSGEKRQGERA